MTTGRLRMAADREDKSQIMQHINAALDLLYKMKRGTPDRDNHVLDTILFTELHLGRAGKAAGELPR